MFKSREEADANYRRLRRLVSVYFPDLTKTTDDDWAVRCLHPDAVAFAETDGEHVWCIRDGEEILFETNYVRALVSREEAEKNLLEVVKALSAELEILEVSVVSARGDS